MVGEALGNRCFRLSKEFRDRLKEAVGLEEEIPKDAFAEVDYHLDWVAAALIAYKEGAVCELLQLSKRPRGREIFHNEHIGESDDKDDGIVAGNQEGVGRFRLLVGFST